MPQTHANKSINDILTQESQNIYTSDTERYFFIVKKVPFFNKPIFCLQRNGIGSVIEAIKGRKGNPNASNGKALHVNWKSDCINFTYKEDL